jgi:FkbM family methyltransferase
MQASLNGERRDFYLRRDTSDIKVLNQIFISGEYDLSALKRYKEILNFVDMAFSLNRPPLIIDCGANNGISSLFFAFEYQNAKIVAVEPDPENFEMLNLNTANLLIDKYQLAVTSSKAELNLDYADGSAWGVRTKPRGNIDSAIIQSVGINELYIKYGQENIPFIVKLDVEGAEFEIFSSNIEWLKHTPIVIVELHDWMLPMELVATPFLKAISAQDRDFIILGENIVSISNNLCSEFCYPEFCESVVIKDNFPHSRPITPARHRSRR